MSFKPVTPLLQGSLPVVGEADPDFATKASPGMVRAVQISERTAGKTMGEVEESTGLADGRLIAKYKIEVLFGPKRTHNGPNAVRIGLWESGSKLHGGGDASLFFCKDGTTEDGEGCWAPIPQDFVKGPFAFCKVCNRTINADKLTLHREGYVSTRFLANELVKIFRQLGSSADIYCKYNADDIHFISMARQHGDEKAKRLLGLHIYPLANLVKDTAAGADLGKRFYTFLTS